MTSLNKISELKSCDLNKVIINFTLLHGRRFSLTLENGNKINAVSLNDLIDFTHKKMATNRENALETEEFVKSFKALEHKGYEKGGAIEKANCVVRLITKIKHFFAGIRRNKLIKKIEQLILPQIPSPNPPTNLPPIPTPQPPILPSKPSLLTRIPKVITEEVFKFLDPVSLHRFSKINRETYAHVRKQENIYNVYILRHALEEWKKADIINSSNQDREFAECAAKLIKYYPNEVILMLDKCLTEAKELRPILKAIKECAKINRDAVLPLCEKAHNIARLKNTAWDLYYVSENFLDLDPQKALKIANEINEPAGHWSWRQMALKKVPAVLIHSDPEQAFNVVKNDIIGFRDKMNVYQSMLSSCNSLDSNKALLLVRQIQEAAEAELANTTEREFVEYHRGGLCCDLVSVYTHFDKEMALRLLQGEKPARMQREWLLSKVSFVNKYYGTIASEIMQPIIDQILTSNILDQEKETKDRSIQRLIEVYIKADELNKAHELFDKLQFPYTKIKVLLDLSKKHQVCDTKKAKEFLEKALLLVDNISRTRECSRAYQNGTQEAALAQIACRYAFFDIEKARALAMRVEMKVRQVGVEYNEQRIGFNPMQVIPPLVKAWFLIDKKYALELIDQLFTDSLDKANTLLEHLSYCSSELGSDP